MGYKTHSGDVPGGSDRNDRDHERLRHARDRHLGFPVGRYLQPPPMLFTRDGHNAFLGDMYRGQAAFLICSGPSLAAHDLSRLHDRGILALSVNNAATVVRTQLWASVDDPGNFSDAIWRDPGIMKFVPLCHMEKQFLVRDHDQLLVPSTERVGDMPAVFGYRRNERFVPRQWLFEDTFNWGNSGQVVDDEGNKGSRSIMYVALRLLFYLGVRRVYLLGCDFKMQVGKQNYAFPQDRTAASVRGNNYSYQVLNKRLRRLQPYFKEHDFQVCNCTPKSGLTVFPYLSYEEALQRASSVQSPIITDGMYDRKHVRPGARAAGATVVVSTSLAADTTIPSPYCAEAPAVKARSPAATASAAANSLAARTNHDSDGDRTTAKIRPAFDSIRNPGRIPPTKTNGRRNSALFIPTSCDLTLVTSVDETTAECFPEIVRTWQTRKPNLLAAGLLVTYDPHWRLARTALTTCEQSFGARCAAWEADVLGTQACRRALGWMKIAASQVKTRWTLFVAPGVIATSTNPGYDPDWPAPPSGSPPPVMIISPCSLSASPELVAACDRWTSALPEFAEKPETGKLAGVTGRLNSRDPPWYVLIQTDWLRSKLARSATKSLPPNVDERMLLYMADRCGDEVVSADPVRYGWRYFRNRRRSLREALSVLESPVY